MIFSADFRTIGRQIAFTIGPRWAKRVRCDTSMKRYLPLIGILISVRLFVLAATYYPGGSTFSASSAGYDWARNFISSLFRPEALNGAANPARYFAIPAMLILCVSVGFVFKNISDSQKLTFIICAGWLYAVHYSEFGGEIEGSAASNNSMAPTW